MVEPKDLQKVPNLESYSAPRLEKVRAKQLVREMEELKDWKLDSQSASMKDSL